MDNFSVKSICIDDFALKKRQRYGTVMVNIETGKIVDMIESREKDDVRRWLLKYPNIRIVSRDGSHAYAAAVTEACPNAMQVSDRFHLVKNLADRANVVFQRMFQGRIAIPATSDTQDMRYQVLIGTKTDRIRLVKKLSNEGRTLDEISILTGLSMNMTQKYKNMSTDTILYERQTVRGIEHENAVQKTLERANHVKSLKESGLNVSQISKKTGFTLAVVKIYLSSDFTPVSGHYGKQREGKLEPYRDEIFRWRAEGLKYREIHDRIKEKGYTGTQDAIRGFISKER